MNLVLFGPPGSGKGTQSKLLLDKGWSHLSTGDLFRAAIKNQTELGKKAKAILDAGNLVPDEITNDLVKEELKKLEDGKSFILDGYPRNTSQAEALKIFSSGLQLPVDKAIFFKVKKELLLERLTGRRVCTNCGASFHVKFTPPAKEGVCDQCHKATLIQRNDDKLEVIENRLNVYDKNTSPLIEFYKKEGIYEEVNASQSPKMVLEELLSIIGNQ